MSIIRLYIGLSSVMFLFAIIFFAWSHHWIILRIPLNVNNEMTYSLMIQKKLITLYYFHGDKWKTEKQEILWSNNKEKNIVQLINTWLIVLDEECITMKKVNLQSVIIAPSGSVYISFDRTILPKEESIFNKWMLIEGLLKTIAVHDKELSHIQFLVQHQPMNDNHLDFSLPWPINGFL